MHARRARAYKRSCAHARTDTHTHARMSCSRVHGGACKGTFQHAYRGALAAQSCKSGLTWAVEPPKRTRRFLSNSACTSPCHREAQKNTQAQQILTVLIARASKGRRYSPFQGARPPPGAMQSSLAGWTPLASRTTRHEKSQVSSRQESGFVNI